MLKGLLEKLMMCCYKYDNRYKIIKNNNLLGGGKTLVLSVDHAWNSVEWCLPGLYYLRQHYNINLVFLALDEGIWQKCMEENIVYKIMKDTFDVIIINTVDTSKYNYIQRKIWRLKKSLLEYNSVKYFFDNISVDMLLSKENPISVHKFFSEYYPNTIKVWYEHSSFQRTLSVYNENEKVATYNADYCLCSDSDLYNLVAEYDKERVLVTGAPQLDAWWRDLISHEELLAMQEEISGECKTILVLLPYLQDDERLCIKDKETLIDVLKLFSENHNIILKFHPRDSRKNIESFINKIFREDSYGKVMVTTLNTECIASIADCVVVAGETSAAAAAIINDIPVIEFHSNSFMPTFYYENGQYGTLFKMKNLCLVAENYGELKKAIHDALYNNAWADYQGKYKNYIQHDNMASERFANVLADIMKYESETECK